MLLASAGGHLDELVILVDLLHVPMEDPVWVTSRNAHTESLLEGKKVIWIPRVGSGETAKAARSLPAALRLHRQVRPDLLVSSGALFSTPHLLASTLMRCETWFIDSATRVHAPSSTGRFAQHLTRAKLFMQQPGWGDSRWTLVPSVFDAFEAVPVIERPAEIRKVVVSLGSELWPFPRAVESVLSLLPDADISWQTGVTEFWRGGSQLRQWVPAADLRRQIAAADLVITHAGVGSVLACLEQGKVPIILPRRSAHREMVDDHQLEFAEMIDAKGLAISLDPSELRLAHLGQAASTTVRRQRPGTSIAE